MMTSTFASRPLGKNKSYFYSTVICIKDPIAYIYLHIGPYSYLRAYLFPYDNINLTLILCFS
jgi:hypothetical protein